MLALIVILLGPDRPGIIEHFAACVAEHGGNWTESRLARLAGKFAGVMRVDVPPDQFEALRAALERLDPAVHVQVEPADEHVELPDQRSVKLEIIGQDRPGIVHGVTQALRERGINVEELQTTVRNAPMSGELMFYGTAQLAVPKATDIDELHDRLDEIAERLHLDISIQMKV